MNHVRTAIVLMWIGIGAVSLILVPFTFGVVLIPLAVFIWWWIRRWRRSPGFQAKQLIKEAEGLPGDQAVQLLHEALEVDPEGSNTLLLCGNWFYEHQCWADATGAYGAYLHYKPNWFIDGRYTSALLRSGQLDEAIERLQQMRSTPGLTDESQASMTANLALAFVLRGDPGQALALASSAPLQKHILDVGLQQCLYQRAIARYLTGQKAKAIADLDRLYAANPGYPGLSEAKSEIQTGTYAVGPCMPYPDWYPRQLLEEARGVDVAPEGSPAWPSEADQQTATTATTQISAPALLSADGRWWWDGTAWQPFNPGRPPPGSPLS